MSSLKEVSVVRARRLIAEEKWLEERKSAEASRAMGNCFVRSPEGAGHGEVLDFGGQGNGAIAGHGAGQEDERHIYIQNNKM